MIDAIYAFSTMEYNILCSYTITLDKTLKRMKRNLTWWWAYSLQSRAYRLCTLTFPTKTLLRHLRTCVFTVVTNAVHVFLSLFRDKSETEEWLKVRLDSSKRIGSTLQNFKSAAKCCMLRCSKKAERKSSATWKLYNQNM